MVRRCVVETMACQTCGSVGAAHVTRSAGYIASVITAETQSSSSCGSSKCPWKIEVESGQTINVTLFDFALEQRASSSSSSVGYVSAENCFRYAVIKEAPSHRSFPVCGGHGRKQFVYSSVTNVIEIHVVSPEVFSQKGQFLIYYEGQSLSVAPYSKYVSKEDICVALYSVHDTHLKSAVVGTC